MKENGILKGKQSTLIGALFMKHFFHKSKIGNQKRIGKRHAKWYLKVLRNSPFSLKLLTLLIQEFSIGSFGIIPITPLPLSVSVHETFTHWTTGEVVFFYFSMLTLNNNFNKDGEFNQPSLYHSHLKRKYFKYYLLVLFRNTLQCGAYIKTARFLFVLFLYGIIIEITMNNDSF